MASDLSSGCTETIDILDDEKEEGEISLEDVSSSEEGGVGHLTSSYVISRRRSCTSCKSWGECTSWCTATYRSKTQSKRDPLKGKENRHHIKEAGCAIIKHTSMLQEKNDDLVPISSDTDMEIVGLTDTSNRSKLKIKKKKRKNYDVLTSSIDKLISPAPVDLPMTDFTTLKTRYRTLSPAHRSTRSRIISKSPNRRYRSPMRARSPVFRSRSPLNYSKSSIVRERRSPRRPRSPKQNSPYHLPMRTIPKKLKLDSSPSTRFRTDKNGDVTRLLKKVKHLDSMGVHTLELNINRNKEHQTSSLKEKIFNMLKKEPDSKDDITHLKEKSKVKNDASNDVDDEEDLALLRQKALETKQKKSNKLDCMIDTEKKQIKDDDQDVEALQLRMIALRSAVMKKHQNRVQRGIRANKKKQTRSESPFNQSFLDDIPIPGDELLKFASPPCTPPHAHFVDSNHTEDMELDTDIEREKEKLPYSPTDRIISEIPVDTALLGIEPSDVSFINVKEKNSPVFDDKREQKEEMSLSNGASQYYNNTYLLHYKTSQDCAYSSSQHDNLIFHSDLNSQSHLTNYRNNNVECDLLDGICCRSGTHSTDTESMKERDTTHILPPTNDILIPCNLLSDNPLMEQMEQVMEKSNESVLFANIPSTFEDKYSYEMQNSEFSEIIDPAETFMEPMSSIRSMITINDFAEMKVESAFNNDNRNLVLDMSKEVTDQEENETILGTIKEESIYVQDIPDITEHLNKIPTLINRTLVPASILKSNKQLRQVLPKKREIHPSFKSAEMQPVIVDTNAKSDSTFKPIKLQPPKKAMPVLTAPIIFDNPNENSENDILENSNNSLSLKNEITIIDNTANNDTISLRKNKQERKKDRCKSVDCTQLLVGKRNNSCTNDTNMAVNTIIMSTSEQQTIEQIIEQNKNNDENKTQECFLDDKESSFESSNLQNARSNTQESDNTNNIVVGNENTNKNEQNIFSEDDEKKKQAILLMPIKHLQEKSKSYPLTDIVSNNNDSGTLNTIEITKNNAINRRQSVDEDENVLRAILLASLAKRSKIIDTNDNSTVSVATNFVTTNTQTTTQNTLINIPITTNTTFTMNSNISSKLSSSEIGEKKTVSTISGYNGKKRINSGTIMNVSKKMMRKMPIPASTKAVNNAKKYQNMMQRKLNLRKLDNACNNVKSNEKIWSNATKTLHTSDTQRFVINLDSDTDSESETEKNKSVISTVEKLQSEVNADFEKSLQKFLRDMRKEQEQSVAAIKSTSSSQVSILSSATKRDTASTTQTDPNKGSSNMHTPLAVRHLPASQQEEYHRLKQQILEREKLKPQRKIADNSNNNNKLLNTKGVINSPVKSLPLCEKKNINIKQNQIISKKSEDEPQKSPIQIRKKNIDAATNTTVLNIFRTSTNKNQSANITKHNNSTQANLQVKGKTKKTIPNNLSIRITNEIAPNHTNINRMVENSIEKQSGNDKQYKSASKTLSKEEINRKHVQIQLKSDAVGRVVTINDKPFLHDTTNVDRTEKPIDSHDISVEILEERNSNNESNKNNSICSDVSTIILPNDCVNLNKQELIDTTLETTVSFSEFEAQINHNILAVSLPENNDNNNTSRKSDVDNKANTDSVLNVLKRNIKTELDSLINLSKAEQQRYLKDIEHKLVAKRYTVLDHLADMSGNVRQWDMEKDLQNNLVVEVKKLKEQLKIAEEKLQVQRDRVNSMGPKMSTARQKINAGRRECFKLSKICSTLGNRLMGKSYKLPEAGNQLLSNKLKEFASHTRHFSKKKRILPHYISGSSCSSSSEQIAESSKIRVKEDLLMQERSNNDTVDVADVIDIPKSKSNSSCLRQSNHDDFLPLEPSLDSSFSNQIVAITKKDTNVSKSYDSEQIISNQCNMLLSVPKLNSTFIEQNSEHMEKDPDISDTISNSKSLITNLFLCKNNEQQNDTEISPRSSTTSTMYTMTMTMTTTAMTTTTTTTITMTTTTMTTTTMTTTTTKTTRTLVPYVSILTHLKTPRNANPHGILCPYEMMGICRDEDCQFIHQSKNEI